MKHSWITLYPDTFLWVKGENGFVYNSSRRKGLSFELSKKIRVVCEELLSIENLYSTKITDDLLQDEHIGKWINNLIIIEAGYLTSNITGIEKKPVSLMPILKIQEDVAYYKWLFKDGLERGVVLRNLSEITFYINGSNDGDDSLFKQAIFPLKKCQTLEMEKVLLFIKHSHNPFLAQFNLVGNIFIYPDYETFLKEIKQFRIRLTIYITISDFLCNMENILKMDWGEHISFHVIFKFKQFADITTIKEKVFPFHIYYTYFIFSEEDYKVLVEIMEQYVFSSNDKVVPIFNGNNVDFFKKYVYIDNEDINNIVLSKRDVFIRQAVNANYFGKLTVLPNGKVYANLNEPALSTIDEAPYKIVYKEIMGTKSWMKLRTQLPCINCVYQWICPSPSNYEDVIGVPNLCHLK
jgi:pseudo-rSAM protein